ncbi:MAG: hypothetical protein FWD05_11560 [Oscillospiraceae bacterium]|nr:hypothetical protein [Oscillospiraceae bacterium]
MEKINLSKKQGADIAKAIYDDVKSHCDSNLKRYLISYRKELENAKGKPIEPITIRFNPYLYPVSINHTNDTDKTVDESGCEQ